MLQGHRGLLRDGSAYSLFWPGETGLDEAWLVQDLGSELDGADVYPVGTAQAEPEKWALRQRYEGKRF